MKGFKSCGRHVYSMATLLVATVAVCAAHDVHAQVPFALVIDSSATVSIKNISSQEWQVYAYDIQSPSGAILPNRWDPIYSQYQRDPMAFTDVFGPTFPKPNIAFGELGTGSPIAIGEALPLIDWRPGLGVPIGKPFGEDVNTIKSLVEQDDLYFEIGIGIGSATNLPILFEIPEPATIILLLYGLPIIYVLARRTRRGGVGVE